MTQQKINIKSSIPATGIKILQQYPRRELYRLIVDGRFHKNEQGWAGYENREKGCLKAAFNGLTLAITKLEDTTLTTDYIKQLHKACTTNILKMNSNRPGVFREAPVRFGLMADMTTRDGLLEILKMMRMGEPIQISSYSLLNKFILSSSNLDQIIQEWNIKNDEELADQLFIKLNDALEFGFSPHDHSLVEERASGLCEKYNTEITNLHDKDAKLELIITTIYALEHLHPFNDGNTRTFSIALLLRLLLQNGFIPPTQFNPNFIEGMSVKEFISEMRQAMGVTENLVNGSNEAFGFSSDNIPEEKQGELLTMTEQFIEVLKSEIYRLENCGLTNTRAESKSEAIMSQQLVDELDKIAPHKRLAYANQQITELTDAIQLVGILKKLDKEDKLLFYKIYTEKLKKGRQLFRVLELFSEDERYAFAMTHIKLESVSDLMSVITLLPEDLRLPYLFYNEKNIKSVESFGAVLDQLANDENKEELEKILFPFVRDRQGFTMFPLKETHRLAYQKFKLKLESRGLQPLEATLIKQPASEMVGSGTKLYSGGVQLWSFNKTISSSLQPDEEVRSNGIYHAK